MRGDRRHRDRRPWARRGSCPRRRAGSDSPMRIAPRSHGRAAARPGARRCRGSCRGRSRASPRDVQIPGSSRITYAMRWRTIWQVSTSRSTVSPRAGKALSISVVSRPRRYAGSWMSRNAASSLSSRSGYTNGTCFARSSTKKSNGLIGRTSTASSTTSSSASTCCPALNVIRATWLPSGSRCQWTRCSGATWSA